MKIFNRFRQSAAGLAVLCLMVMVAMASGGRWMYAEYRADVREDMATLLQTQREVTPDVVQACLAWAADNGQADTVCQPFVGTEWAVMNGGRPQGDGEGLADWFYHYTPDGTMILGPGRLRIWIPADRRTCPAVLVGDMVDSQCPAWMPVERAEQ